MRMTAAVTALVAILVALVGCGSDGNNSGNASGNNPSPNALATPTSGTNSADAAGGTVCTNTDASGDLLAEVCESGEIRSAAYAEFQPVTFLNKETGEWEGFDIDVTTEIAERLGVSIEYVTPSFDVITAGSWSGRWEMGGGSMVPTAERREALYFTEPYYYTPAVVVVHEENTSYQDISTDLDGATIGVASGTIYESYLNKDVELPGFSGEYPVDDANVRAYDTSFTALQDLSLGDGVRLDAIINDRLSVEQWIEDGQPVKIVGGPVLSEPLALSFDKNSPSDSTSLYEAVDEIISEMREDGTLSSLSKKWFDGIDLTTAE